MSFFCVAYGLQKIRKVFRPVNKFPQLPRDKRILKNLRDLREVIIYWILGRSERYLP